MKLSSFSLIDETEDAPDTEALVAGFNQTRRDYPRDRSIADLFSEQAAARPDAPALSMEGTSLSYGALEARANRLARLLRERIGETDGKLIALGLERSFEMIVALLAILKTGAAYLPLDPDYPPERLRFMLAHSGALALVTRTGLCPGLAQDGVATILLDREEETLRRIVPDPLPPVEADAPGDPGGRLAYVMYTSGSTGRPKAVAVPQRAVIRLVRGANYADFGAEQVFLQYAPVSFDAATFEIWGPLLNGARLAIAPGGKQSLSALGETIRREGVTVLWLTGGLFNVMIDTDPESLKPLRQLLVGGEALSVSHIRKALDLLPGCRLVNGYGPTENTTFSCCFPIAPAAYRNAIPIGGPIANSTAYILDEALRPLPPGVAGELYVGGDGLALGYWNDPALTAERFIASPFGAGERLYRTGDLAAWREDGVIDYLGRMDDQIKIRGFRIEPGEIEFAITGFPGCAAAVAQAWSAAPAQSGQDRRMLVAHYTATEEIEESALRAHLESRLPPFMVPAHLIRVDRLPLNPNGKIDRKALPPPALDAGADTHMPEPPEGETETALAAIWEELLGQGPVCATDDFFALGGHSLMAARMVAAMEKRFGASLPLTAILTHPTVRALASLLLDAARFGDEAIDRPLIRLSGAPGDRPLFALPPGTTDALGYGRLATSLSGIAVQAFNFIEAESRIGDYADLISETDPDGPHLLFGYSGGGNLAFLVAQELERRGRPVAAVLMLDSSRFLAPFAFPETEAERLARGVLEADGVNRVITGSLLRDKLHRRIRRYYAFLSSLQERGRIKADIHLISSPTGDDVYRGEDGGIIASKPAWAELTEGGFHRHEGAGAHGDMLLEPHFRANAALIGELIAAFPERAS